MKLKTQMLFVMVIVTLFMGGNHLHDLGLKAQFDNLREGSNTNVVGNGFYDLDASKAYHVGWYVMYLAFFVLVIAYIRLLKGD